MQINVAPNELQQINACAKKYTKKYKCIPVNFTKEQVTQIDEIAQSEGSNRSEIIRYAVERLLISRRQDYYDERETTLIRELKRIEKGLRTLIAKGVRLNAQAFYFAALPFQLGPPKAALTKQSYNHQYERSLGFASMVLKDSTSSDQIKTSGDATIEMPTGDSS